MRQQPSPRASSDAPDRPNSQPGNDPQPARPWANRACTYLGTSRDVPRFPAARHVEVSSDDGVRCGFRLKPWAALACFGCGKLGALEPLESNGEWGQVRCREARFVTERARGL